MPSTTDLLDPELLIQRAYIRSVPQAYRRCIRPVSIKDDIDVTLARRQHRTYARALSDAGVQVASIPADETLPDSPFIEDVAVIVGRHAVLARSATFSRSRESADLRPWLETTHSIDVMPPGATLDGGDVLQIGNTLHVGLSKRTNEAGVAFLARIAQTARLEVRTIPVTGALHLKSLCTYLGRGVLLHVAGKVRADAFPGLQLVCAPESKGASVLPVNDRVFVPEEAPRTADLIARTGFPVVTMAMSEFMKGNGSIGGLSLRIPGRPLQS